MINIPMHSLYMMAAIILVLVVGTLVYFYLSHHNLNRDYQELKLRIRSWWWMIGIVFVVLYLPTQYALLFVAFLYIIFIPVFIFLYLPMVAGLIGDTKGFIRSVGIIHWALMLTVFCVSHMAYLLVLQARI